MMMRCNLSPLNPGLLTHQPLKVVVEEEDLEVEQILDHTPQDLDVEQQVGYNISCVGLMSLT